MTRSSSQKPVAKMSGRFVQIYLICDHSWPWPPLHRMYSVVFGSFPRVVFYARVSICAEEGLASAYLPAFGIAAPIKRNSIACLGYVRAPTQALSEYSYWIHTKQTGGERNRIQFIGCQRICMFVRPLVHNTFTQTHSRRINNSFLLSKLPLGETVLF